jgi:hypothetical protein
VSKGGDQLSYTNNRIAAANRRAKAEQIAAWCWNQGLTWEHLEYTSDAEWNTLCRLAIKRTASDQTRRLVQALITIKENWAEAHPDHPQARRTVRSPEDVAQLKTGSR